jgi:hypothetical protein
MWSSIFSDETGVAGTHDRELRPAAPGRDAILTPIARKLMHHNRLMTDDLNWIRRACAIFDCAVATVYRP